MFFIVINSFKLSLKPLGFKIPYQKKVLKAHFFYLKLEINRIADEKNHQKELF